MRILRTVAAALLMTAMLAACATLALPERRNQLVGDVQDFTQRLRWKDINGAADYFEKQPGEAFREMFADTQDLHIVDVKVERVDMPQPELATVNFSYQYYELPSITVRRESVEQEWVLHPRGKGLPGEWKIASEFPERR
ncbi:MAG: hypothetical protein GWO11_02335 [Desulfuromonadales bacterium]|nr:hypothetical protein [Desulfuromonadales bacterium]NIS42109.1 hypothetical protein [Desulfuromonadales bacterium]